MQIPLKLSERWLFCGKTGSGKTTLARACLTHMAAKSVPILIIDSPDHFWLGERHAKFPTKGQGTVKSPRLITNGRLHNDYAVQIYQPTTPGWEDEIFLSLMRQVYERGDMLFYMDELNGMVDAHHEPVEFKEIWTQGRKINVGAWCSCQRPVSIPENVKSQAENIAVFRLTKFDDRKTMSNYTSTPRILPRALPKWEWFYYNQEMDEAVKMRPIHV